MHNTEELVFPPIHQQRGDPSYGAVARRLMVDDAAQDALWVFNRMALSVPATA